MKSIASLVLLVSFASQIIGSEPSIQFQLTKDGLTADDRDALVTRWKKETFEKIAPVLLIKICDHSHLGFCHPFPPGEKPWNNDRLSAACKTHIMAVIAWKHHMNPFDDPSKAKFLLSLLQKSTNESEKSFLISAIQNQWIDEAEHVLSKIASDESSGIRGVALSTLLNRSDINTYMPIAMEFVLSQKRQLDRIQSFSSLTNLGNQLFNLTEQNKQLVLSTGFQLLSELPEEELQLGYGVARCLGFILKIEDEFSPDQNAAKYKTESGLKEEFFSDTTKNALKWHAENFL